MAKKSKPSAEQTVRLSKAKWEFLKRNRELWEAENGDDRMRRFREFYADALKSVESVKRYRQERGLPAKKRTHLDVRLRPFPTDPDECMSLVAQRAAAKGIYDPFIESRKSKGPFTPEEDQQWLDRLKRQGSYILNRLTSGQPSKTLLLGVDLSRSKEAILAEVEMLVDHYREVYQEVNGAERLRWLPIAEELLEVWDLYEQAGKSPARVTFRTVSKKVNRPLSTVKSQWRLAYELIHGEPYDPDAKYANERTRAAADHLCARCPHGAKCYRGGGWYPCSDYLAVAGKDREPRTVEFSENIDYTDPD